MDRESELLKAFANRVAQFSGSARELQIVRSIQLSGVFDTRRPNRDRPQDPIQTDSLSVGIWRRQNEEADTPFLRRTDAQREWFYWADQPRIEPKRRKWRVALVGESVARGYLYDPHFTPALVLEKMLQCQLEVSEIDVVDLAKSNLTIEQLGTTVAQSLALAPDVIVIFAGNNWRPHLTEPDMPYVDALLRDGGVPAMKAFLDVRTARSVADLVERVSKLAEQRNIKVIWVVPEFNLADWADPISDAPLLRNGSNERWRELKRLAQRAIDVGNFAEARKLAEEMLVLDGGTNAVPLRMLAHISQLQGDLQQTRQYLELSRDAEGWDPSFSYSPRVSSVIQQALRAAASPTNQVVVDLPDVLRTYCKDALPGRELFLDYCHLTSLGMKLAMSAVTSHVLTLLTGQTVQQKEIQSLSPSPSSQVEGKASLLAAIHNAHFYQSPDLVGHWCNRALQLWPECAEIMECFVDFQTRRAPLMACKSLIELSSSDNYDLLTYILRGGKKRLDLLLTDAMVASLRVVGRDLTDEVASLRATEHSLGTSSRDLTDFYYMSTMLSPPYEGWTSKSFSDNRASPTIYAAALLDRSKFVFFAEENRSVAMKCTYRIPNVLKSVGAIRFLVNGHVIEQACADTDWHTIEVSIPGDKVNQGMNEVFIDWPTVAMSPDDALGTAADSLLSRKLPRFYRTFGEIQTLTARQL